MHNNQDQGPTTNSLVPIQRICLLFKSIPLVILAFLLISCGSNSTGTNGGGGDNGGGDNPPPTEPTFANVQDIFNSNCGGSSCHLNNRESGVRLDSYDNVISSEGVQYGGKVVVPNEPNNSPLVDKIETDPEFGDRMPKDGAPLSSDEITLIREWISEGAQNN